MVLRVVGAGLGRTGTHSLKLALERLQGQPCYHMLEVFGRPADVGAWHAAALGGSPDWARLLEGYGAIVDWPGAAFWRDLADANPDALVLLSTRDGAATWWTSASSTIFEALDRPLPVAMEGFQDMVSALLDRHFTPRWRDREEAMAAYERHNDDVRASLAPDRLLEWQPGDGWGPLAAALGVPVPEEPFPHANSTAEARVMMGLDTPPEG